jgi:3',5'-cyclic AMP phosphodiesterase CpdA
VPFVTGDMMDSPSDKNLDLVRLFFTFLKELNVAPPLAVLGNHDVRKYGWLQRILGKALQLPTTHGVHWYDEAKVGIACFNSVVEGHLAGGYIGARQLIDIANEIDGNAEHREFAIVGVLHHHPMPVEMPDWITPTFYERYFGKPVEKTTVLEDAAAFIEHVEAMPMAAVLHGHQHIPHIAETPRLQIPIFGCGSSVGKVKTKNASETCISINVISLDVGKQHLTGRVLAERVIGAGLSPIDRHAMVYRRRANWVDNALGN